MNNNNIAILGRPECITLGQHLVWQKAYECFGGTDLFPEYISADWARHTEDGWNMLPSKYLVILEEYENALRHDTSKRPQGNKLVWRRRSPGVDTSGTLGIALIYKTNVMKLEIYHDHILVDCPDDPSWEPVWVDTDDHDHDLTWWKETMIAVDKYHKSVNESTWHEDGYTQLGELDIPMILIKGD